jgi:hypothetical protein
MAPTASLLLMLANLSCGRASEWLRDRVIDNDGALAERGGRFAESGQLTDHGFSKPAMKFTVSWLRSCTIWGSVAD